MINITEFKSTIELLKTFHNEEGCVAYLEYFRWNGNVVSPFDAKSKVYKCNNGRYKCKTTGRYFNVLTETMFENTKIPLQKWFLAMWLITSHKKGISSIQLGKDINVTQKTAWFLNHRIRACFGLDNQGMIGGDGREVEIDETYVGGKNKNRHKDKKVKGNQGRAFKDKTPVVGMLEREGKIVAKVTNGVGSDILTPLVKDTISADTTIYTDEWGGYSEVSKIYTHKFVKHGQGQYVDGVVHTNTMEGFWSILKRGIIGIYHFTSRKHLQKYVDEFVFRYNTRHYELECTRFYFLLTNNGIRTKYRDLKSPK